MTVIVQAGSVYEAAALAMDALRKSNGLPSDLHVTMHVPAKTRTVTAQQLNRWGCLYPSRENIGMKHTRQRVEDFLKPYLASGESRRPR